MVLSRTFELREDSGNIAVIFQPDRHYGEPARPQSWLACRGWLLVIISLKQVSFMGEHHQCCAAGNKRLAEPGL